MTLRLRKLALTAHITFSVGWLGAVVAYLALAIVGLTSRDAQIVRAAYLSMELIGWFVIVPFSLAALLTGLVQSLGTQWGLFRHYWILVKFLLTTGATTPTAISRTKRCPRMVTGPNLDEIFACAPVRIRARSCRLRCTASRSAAAKAPMIDAFAHQAIHRTAPDHPVRQSLIVAGRQIQHRWKSSAPQQIVQPFLTATPLHAIIQYHCVIAQRRKC